MALLGWLREAGSPSAVGILFAAIDLLAATQGFSSAPYCKSCERNELENNSFIFFLLSEVSIVS